MSHGQKLGRYTLVEQLAIGGMAEIWLAHMAGPEGFEKVVVIKKIRPHLAKQKNFLNMFLNEARLVAQLNHPNIVQIHEFGNPEDQHYIAMEYIFGRDLSEIVPKAKRANIPFPVEYATKIIIQVCEGLYHAHTKTDKQGKPLKIIHRDISPQNVIVSFDGHVKILDFGIAKAANQCEETQQGILKGKVSYMAPEQILGTGFDNRVDIFSLGAVFYELVTGYKLFSGDNELAILRSITDGPIYPPSYFNEEVPPELEDIILKALAKHPDERYPNAWEMQRALIELLAQFDFHPTNTHLSNFLKQLFEDEMEQEAQYLEQKLEEVIGKNEQKEEQSPPSQDEQYPVPHGTIDTLEAFDERIAIPTQHEPTPSPKAKTGTKRLSDTRPDLELLALSHDDEIESINEFVLPMIVPLAEISSKKSSGLPPHGSSDTQISVAMPASNTNTDLPSVTENRTQPETEGIEVLSEKLVRKGNAQGIVSDIHEEEVETLGFSNSVEEDQAEIQIDSLEESMSQILFTMRFRSRDYDSLKEIATYHNLSLEQLIHAMLECAKPFFDGEIDLKPSSS